MNSRNVYSKNIQTQIMASFVG